LEGTIEENLSWGLKSVSEAQIYEVIDLVGLTPLIDSLPNGVDTQVWPGTSLLYWGESIRLEMARVLLRKPTWVVISSLFQQIPRDTQDSLLKIFKEKGIGVIVFSSGYGRRPDGFDVELSFNRMERSNPPGNTSGGRS
jgi:ABC-type uncharacterized transport system fused permease/ATPase subunit